ncbi:MAG: type VI secretion system baseplate subunit TssE [Deltaproteobacteria bacterium]|jgi:type VI secretion system protein|nr:type VI secretion system baseplate subunit TssE [Deltaproteobacteria bacterium]
MPKGVQVVRLRLLERIRNASKFPNYIETNTGEALADSLQKHLALILNTHQGSSASAPDFGMPDFVNLSEQSDLDSLRELSKILTQVISKYEPRLKNSLVIYSESNLETGVLEFSLTGYVEINEEKRNLFFSANINPDGKIDVRK